MPLRLRKYNVDVLVREGCDVVHTLKGFLLGRDGPKGLSEAEAAADGVPVRDIREQLRGGRRGLCPETLPF